MEGGASPWFARFPGCRFGREDAVEKASMDQEQAEYIDFYNAGIDDDDLRKSGFKRRIPNDNTVIPNYFEPFAKENVEISFVIRLPAGKKYRVVKGDSDQDRPNIIQGVNS